MTFFIFTVIWFTFQNLSSNISKNNNNQKTLLAINICIQKIRTINNQNMWLIIIKNKICPLLSLLGRAQAPKPAEPWLPDTSPCG
jgi:hypothetical protein